jgi:Domain of unknown function (DUF4126)
MKLLLDILQGIGVSTSEGIRPFLPALVAGGLGAANLGVDYSGTDFAFLESPWFLLAVAVALVVSILVRQVRESTAGTAAIAGIAIGLGAVQFAGTLADHGYSPVLGIVLGALFAALAQATVRRILAGAASRLDKAARAALPVYAEGAAAVSCAACILVPPLAVVAVGFIARLLVAGRKREGEKYAGLRILR